MTESPEVKSVTLTRVFDAPIDLVYEAWTRAEHVCRWMKCDNDATLEVEDWEPAVGATYKTHMFQEGVFEVWTTGRFTEVDPPSVLEYVSDPDPNLQMPEMRIRVELREQDGRTQLTLTHSGMPTDDICGVIEGGWTNSLSMLGELVASPEMAR